MERCLWEINIEIKVTVGGRHEKLLEMDGTQNNFRVTISQNNDNYK